MPELAKPWMHGGSKETGADRSIDLLPCAEFFEDGAVGAVTPPRMLRSNGPERQSRPEKPRCGHSV